MQDGKVVLPLGVSAQGDVVISLYHMRSTIGGRLQAKVPRPAGYRFGSITAVEALGAYCVLNDQHNVLALKFNLALGYPDLGAPRN